MKGHSSWTCWIIPPHLELLWTRGRHRDLNPRKGSHLRIYQATSILLCLVGFEFAMMEPVHRLVDCLDSEAIGDSSQPKGSNPNWQGPDPVIWHSPWRFHSGHHCTLSGAKWHCIASPKLPKCLQPYALGLPHLLCPINITDTLEKEHLTDRHNHIWCAYLPQTLPLSGQLQKYQN